MAGSTYEVINELQDQIDARTAALESLSVISELSVLSLRPGECLAVKTCAVLSDSARCAIRAAIQRVVGADVGVLVLDPGVTLEKVQSHIDLQTGGDVNNPEPRKCET